MQALLPKTDAELVYLYQRHPEMGQYFAAIFCRYGHVVYSLMANASPSPVQTDFLFVKIWERVFNELRSLDYRSMESKFPLQAWLLNLSALSITQILLPPPEQIQYVLAEVSPVFWCYLNQALNLLPGNLRLIMILTATFHWKPNRIAAYLQTEGEMVDAEQVSVLVEQAHDKIIATMPSDIREIYLT